MKLEIGKCYRHSSGAEIQVVALRAADFDCQFVDANSKLLLEGISRSGWESQAIEIPPNHRASIPCEDCKMFCKQQCWREELVFTVIKNRNNDLLPNVKISVPGWVLTQ